MKRFFFSFTDIRLGRNLARAFLEYYRFTNVLAIPPLKELMANRKRKKSNRNQAYRKRQEEYQPRPRTARPPAPIKYFDLGIDYDSSSSVEGSPVRYPFHNTVNRAKSCIPNQQMTDQFSLLTIKNSTFTQLDFSHKPKATHTSQIPVAPKVVFVKEPSRPHLSIIDVNQLTRGSLEEAKHKVHQTEKETKIKSRF